MDHRAVRASIGFRAMSLRMVMLASLLAGLPNGAWAQGQLRGQARAPVAAPQNQSPAAPSSPAAAAQTGISLAGVWSNGSPTLLRHVVPGTGTLIPGYGLGASYEFFPDGTYRYAQMASQGKDPCIRTSFMYQEGVLSLNGPTITFHSKKNIVSTAGCGMALARNELGPKDDTFPFVAGKDRHHGNRPAIKVGAVVFLKNK
jgi:hypothetical protein